MIIFLYIIIVVFFYFLIRHVILFDKHLKWFKTLKPDDRVRVRIYSNFCECYRTATIKSSPEIHVGAQGRKNWYVEAEIDNKEECKFCAEKHSIDNDGKVTCWYEVTLFPVSDVEKIKIK